MTTLTLQQALDLAMEHHRVGRLAEAESIYRQVLAAAPGDADVVHLLGLVAYHAGRFPEALEQMRQSITLNPQMARYYINLSPLLIDMGHFAEAVLACGTATRLDPGNAVAFYNLGLAEEKQRHFEEAIAAYRWVIVLDPGYRMAWLNLGALFNASGQTEAAIEHYGEARKRFPNDAAMVTNLGSIHHDAGRLEEAIACCREALVLDPRNTVARNNLGIALKDQGDLDGAVAELRQLLAHYAGGAEAHSNLILTLSYLPGEPAEIAAECARWNQLHAAPLRAHWQAHLNDPSPHRRLRIGYLSADLRDHVVGRALWPVFASHDHTQFEVFCYSNSAPDAVSDRFRSRADGWREVAELTDERLAALIRADGIDILIDLGLHTAHHRLLTLARKPAPVQINWLGYPGPSGLEAIDYRFTDRFLDPPDADENPPFEWPIRLPECWTIYDAPEDSPDPGPLPAASNGAVTFGSFNNFCKINHSVWEVWARVLAAVEGSNLLLLAKTGAHRDRARFELQRRGIDPGRVGFSGFRPATAETSAATWLERYREVDIALDPFPYNGMTTTCDALWMGVPVIALAGRTSLGRASLSLLSNVGLPELVAASPEEYVRLAASLAGDLPRLAALRAELRGRMSASPLLDAPRLARHVETALRAVWMQWGKTYGCPPERSL